MKLEATVEVFMALKNMRKTPGDCKEKCSREIVPPVSQRALFDTPVILLKFAVVLREHFALRLAILERLLISEQGRDLLMQRAMIAFQHQQVVRPREMNLLRDFVLAAHGVQTDGGSFDIELTKQLRNGGDFVAHSID